MFGLVQLSERFDRRVLVNLVISVALPRTDAGHALIVRRL